MKPCVAVCIPSMGTWAAKTGASVVGLALNAALHGVFGCLIPAEGSVPSKARNDIVRQALALSQINCLLWTDADMTFIPPSLTRMLSHDKDIVGAFGRSRKPPYNLLGKLFEPPVVDGDLHLVERMGSAFVLVKKSVYETVPPPWYFESYHDWAKSPDNPDGLVGEDINFVLKAREHGVLSWCDVEVTKRLGHIGETVFMGEMEGLPGLITPSQTNHPSETAPQAS